MRRVRAMLNPERRLHRWMRKGALLLIVFVGVLYPNPVLLLRNIDHWMHLDGLPEPDHPGLDAIAAELAGPLAAVGNDEAAFRIVQRAVVERLPYEWDWNVWGVADYVPTVGEALSKGREDCDGQAVVAASLLRRFGYDAHLVSDGSHVWVWTPNGQAMSPSETSSGHSIVTADEDGSRLDAWALLHPRALLEDWPRTLGYGVHVFPLGREVLLIGAVWVCLLGVTVRRRRDVLAGAGLLAGLLLLRVGGGWEAGGGVMALGVVWLGLVCWGAALWPRHWVPSMWRSASEGVCEPR